MRPRCLTLGSWSAVITLAACTVSGTEVETTFGQSASGQPMTTSATTPATATSGSSSGEGGSGSSEDSGSGTSNGTDPTGTSGGMADEQPANGQYSECSMPGDCIGQNTCVLVTGAMGGGGFCSQLGCIDPAACTANPGMTSTATPQCVDDQAGGSVCALVCTGNLTCPGGMECLALGAIMVCA